jgi:hypothetical protein
MSAIKEFFQDIPGAIQAGIQTGGGGGTSEGFDAGDVLGSYAALTGPTIPEDRELVLPWNWDEADQEMEDVASGNLALDPLAGQVPQGAESTFLATEQAELFEEPVLEVTPPVIPSAGTDAIPTWDDIVPPNTTTPTASAGLPASCLPPKRTCYQECQQKDKILTEMCRKLNKDHVIYLRTLGCKGSCSVPSQGKTCSKKKYKKKGCSSY